ncbi:PEGA domain-containing protein [Halalkalibaculum sp. DA384]|uniref:PEGA domain-containing protein n=1 Tax=Halalkalibaculum sp. DA384 TaxID=3373606 RepID=UPI0037544092
MSFTHKAPIATLLIVSFFLTSCATIFKGSTAEVRFNSSPSGAEVLIDEINKGETPTSAQLARSESHTVTFQKDGYEDVKVKINKKFDGATTILGNLVSWWLLGVVVDVASGAAYTLSPADIDGNLNELENAGVIDTDELPKPEENTIHVFMITQEEWQQIQNSK